MITTRADRMRRWCSEPLVHFLLIGMVIFIIYPWISTKPGKDQIDISLSLIEGVCQDHLRRTGASPQLDEKQGLIENLIDEEVLLREALAMGLDQGDAIVRRRLIQKMEFLIEEVNPVSEPTEDELQEYLEGNLEFFVTPERISLSHVFLKYSGLVDQLETEVEPLLEKLSAGVAPGQLGDPFVLGTHFSKRSKKALAAKFGHQFAETVMTLPVGAWSGPIQSSYGFHLVLISDKIGAQKPDLEEVRPQVLRQLKAETQRETRRQAIRRLWDRYVIKIGGREGQSISTLLKGGEGPTS